MAIGERPTRLITPPPTHSRRPRTFANLAGGATLAIAIAIGGASVVGYNKGVEVEQQAFEDSLQSREFMRELLKTTYSPNYLRSDVLVQLPPEALVVPRSNYVDDLLRQFVRNKPDWVPTFYTEADLPMPQRRKIAIWAEGAALTDIQNDQMDLILPGNWLQGLNIPISMRLYGNFQSEGNKLPQAKEMEIYMNLLSTGSPIADPFHAARRQFVQSGNPSPQLLPDGKRLDPTKVPTDQLLVILENILNIPTQKAHAEEVLLPRPYVQNYLSPGVQAEYIAVDGKKTVVTLNSLADFTLKKPLR